MTDSDREKRIEKVKDEIRAAIPMRSWPKDLFLSSFARQIVDALGPVVPLERAQELERERDEAVAAARDFEECLSRTAKWIGACDGPQAVLDSIAEILARHPSFLPPDREE